VTAHQSHHKRNSKQEVANVACEIYLHAVRALALAFFLAAASALQHVVIAVVTMLIPKNTNSLLMGVHQNDGMQTIP
jgi:hypothetical protein